jgi:hypothetical protein
LPQYFRHSRFQSLVRQLNFYNFRKVNRERTFWIYKHRLFHRDHPEDLHLLRRRTCPGVDGRKNRFSNYSRKASDETERRDEGYDEQKSSGESSEENEDSETRRKKRSFGGSGREGDNKRRGGSLISPALKSDRIDDSVVVDLSLVGAIRASMTSKVSQLHTVVEVDSSSDKEVDERLARREQAHVVSQVAMKLEEYARKAKKSRGGSRHGVGIVTPPLGGGQCYRSVLTYDDEYEAMAMASRLSSTSGTVVTDVESQTSDDDYPALPVTPSPSRPTLVIFGQPPVGNLNLIKSIGDQIMDSGRDQASKMASAAIACFCMANTPNEQEGEACANILGLLSTCDKLANEFMQYRYALHPLDCSNTMSYSTFCAPGFRNDNTVFSIHQIWERAASRRDAVRDFKTFAVNYINADMEQMEFPDEEAGALRLTAQVWLKSARVNA